MPEQRSHPILSIVCSVLLPVLVLKYCSAVGNGWYDLGPTVALVVALCMPIGYGLWCIWGRRGGGAITLLGIITTLLTGLVTIYAQAGAGEALRPSTPWVYAFKEGALPLIIAMVILWGGTGKSSLLRTLFYTDAAFHTRETEARIATLHREAEYHALLSLMKCLLAGMYLASAVLSFFIALHFQLPILKLPPAQQAEAYNYAVGSITFWTWLIISIPAILLVLALCFYLPRKLRKLTQP